MEKKPDKRLSKKKLENELRVFGFSFSAGMAILSIILIVRQVEYFYILIPAALGLFHLTAVIFYRELLKPTFYFTRFIGNIVGQIITFIVFSAIYYILFTPISIILRLAGKDQIAKKSVTPQWEDVPVEENDPARVLKQF